MRVQYMESYRPHRQLHSDGNATWNNLACCLAISASLRGANAHQGMQTSCDRLLDLHGVLNSFHVDTKHMLSRCYCWLHINFDPPTPTKKKKELPHMILSWWRSQRHSKCLPEPRTRLVNYSSQFRISPNTTVRRPGRTHPQSSRPLVLCHHHRAP